MREVVGSIEAEMRRYKSLAEAAMAQLSEAELSAVEPFGGSSVAVIAWHVAGNLRSRFTDFLTSDGEKPWRNRDGEFAARAPGREELQAHWEAGWSTLLDALAGLDDGDLGKTVTIRGVGLAVREALLRSMAHAAYHVGQIALLAKARRGDDWQYLSIPPGGSEAYNRNPTRERAAAHSERLSSRPADHRA